MSKKWWVLLVAGAVATTVGVAVLRKKRQKDESCGLYPEFCGYCGDADIMTRECDDGIYLSNILRGGTRL